MFTLPMFLEFLPFQKLKYTQLYVPNSKFDFGICTCIVYVNMYMYSVC